MRPYFILRQKKITCIDGPLSRLWLLPQYPVEMRHPKTEIPRRIILITETKNIHMHPTSFAIILWTVLISYIPHFYAQDIISFIKKEVQPLFPFFSFIEFVKIKSCRKTCQLNITLIYNKHTITPNKFHCALII